MEFSGFPRGVHATLVPDPVLGILLEQIQDLAELKVTLRGFWLAGQKKGALRTIALDEFLNDKVLVQGLSEVSQSPQDAIRRGLELAVKRRTFLAFQSDSTNPNDKLYVINTESALPTIERLIAQGKLVTAPRLDADLSDTQPAEDKPNIFLLYEQRFGLLFSPSNAEEMKEAEEIYSWDLIKKAFDIAVQKNALNWRYVSGILRHEAAEGKKDGESRRHSQKDNPTDYLGEYRRRRGNLPWESRDN
ncbi:MAG: DnaD domain protein [Chloroflexi bacterium]|nr:DnaD domain protein [Chloroflexota bacterium]